MHIYQIPSCNCVVQCITSQLSSEVSVRHLQHGRFQHDRRSTRTGTRKSGLTGLCHQFNLTGPKILVSQTPTYSSRRPRHFLLADPNIFFPQTPTFSSRKPRHFLLADPNILVSQTPTFSSRRPQHFLLTDRNIFILQTPTFSSHRQQHFHLTDP